MTLEEMKAAALNGLGSLAPNDKPSPEAMAYANPTLPAAPTGPKDQWDRGTEPGLNETSGLDILREPKAAATKAMGDNPMSQLMNLLVPDEVSPGMLSGMAGVGVMKPKTAMKNLTTKGLESWDKDAVSKAVAEKLGGDKEIPMWKKKMMQPKN